MRWFRAWATAISRVPALTRSKPTKWCRPDGPTTCWIPCREIMVRTVTSTRARTRAASSGGSRAIAACLRWAWEPAPRSPGAPAAEPYERSRSGAGDRRLRADRRLPRLGAGLARGVDRLVLPAAAGQRQLLRSAAGLAARGLLLGVAALKAAIAPKLLRERHARAADHARERSGRDLRVGLFRDARASSARFRPRAGADRRVLTRHRRREPRDRAALRLRRRAALVAASGNRVVHRDWRRRRAAGVERVGAGDRRRLAARTRQAHARGALAAAAAVRAPASAARGAAGGARCRRGGRPPAGDAVVVAAVAQETARRGVRAG